MPHAYTQAYYGISFVPSSDAVEQLAEHAEKANPSIVDSLSNFYAQHSTLVKTLGDGALTIALVKIAERQQPAPK